MSGQSRLQAQQREIEELRARLEQAEQALQNHQTFDRTLLDHLPAPAFVYDRQTLGYLCVSDAAVAEYGYSRQEFLRMTIADIRPREDVPALLDMLAKSGTGLENRGLWRHQRKDGTLIDVEITSHGLELFDRPACVVLAKNVTAQRRAQEALRTSEARHQAVIEASLDCMVTINVAGEIVEFNRAAERTFGYARAEVLGKPMAEMIIPAHARTDHGRGMARYLATGKGSIIGTRTVTEAMRRDGSTFPAELTIVPIQLQDQLLFTGFLRDITERKRTDAALAASEERYRSIVQLSPDIIFISRDGRITFINQAGVELLGAGSPEEIVGRSPLDFFHPDYHAVIRRRVQQLQANGGSVPLLAQQMISLDGTLIDVEVRATSLFDDQRIEIQVVCRDVRQRKRSEEALHAAKVFADTLIESVSGLFYVLDQNGYFVRWNQQLLDLLELTADAMPSTHALAFVHPDDHEQLGAAIATAFAQGHADSEARLIPSGGPRHFLLSGRRLDIHGKVYLVGSGAEITDRKQAEEEIRLLNHSLAQRVAERTAELTAANAELNQANVAKSEFLATMSHELRTPLNGILGMNELLLASDLGERQRQYVLASESSGKLLKQLIDDVLDLSKIEAGKLELEERPCDLETLLNDVTESMVYLAEQKGLALTCRIAPQACVQIQCDDNRLRQILVNLIGNALKFTSTGSVTVTADCAHQPDGRVSVRFAVLDTGPGIPEERRHRLFNAFSQVDSSTTRRFGGTGLGLSICRQLVTLMSGNIAVESQVGVGSTFWFEIPFNLIPSSRKLGQGRPDTLLQATQAVLCGSGTAGPSVVAQRSPAKPARPVLLSGHILVAEDNSINQLYIGELLSLFGCTYHLVVNGEEVLAKVATTHYDLVLMDCQMPEMDGFAATQEIRKREATGQLLGHLPIIALTANALTGDRQRCLDAGMDEYVSKPVEGHQLRALLQKMLSGRP